MEKLSFTQKGIPFEMQHVFVFSKATRKWQTRTVFSPVLGWAKQKKSLWFVHAPYFCSIHSRGKLVSSCIRSHLFLLARIQSVGQFHSPNFFGLMFLKQQSPVCFVANHIWNWGLFRKQYVIHVKNGKGSGHPSVYSAWCNSLDPGLYRFPWSSIAATECLEAGLLLPRDLSP